MKKKVLGLLEMLLPTERSPAHHGVTNISNQCRSQGQEAEVIPESRPLSPSMEKADLTHKSQANSCTSQEYEAHRGQPSLVEAAVPGFSSDARGRRYARR